MSKSEIKQCALIVLAGLLVMFGLWRVYVNWNNQNDKCGSEVKSYMVSDVPLTEDCIGWYDE